jgi:hypothetical protein
MFFTGHQAFLDRHEEIFKGMFRVTVLRQDVVSLRFVRPEVTAVETQGSPGFPRRVRHQARPPMPRDACALGSCR